MLPDCPTPQAAMPLPALPGAACVLLCLALALCSAITPASAQSELTRANYQDLEHRLNARHDFEDIAAPDEPGLAIDTRIEGPGITLGEHLTGQSVVTAPLPNDPAAQMDSLQNAPTNLSAQPGGAGQNLAVARHRGLGSTALYALGPAGFPNRAALGEGSLAVVFATEQSAFGFRLHADYADPLGARPAPGRAHLKAWTRDAQLLASEAIPLTHGVMELGWRLPDGTPRIAAFTLVPEDPGGYAVDDILYHWPDLSS